MAGFIKLYKQITENVVWSDKPFARGQAWIDLLLLANFADGEMFSKGSIINVKRGQVFRTIGYLSERWGWSAKKTKSFLKLLENQKMVTTKGLPQGTLITIEKYSDFQSEGTSAEPSQGLTEDQPRPNQDLTVTDKIIKNKKNKKNNKEKDTYSAETAEIIYYLNELTGQHYRTTTKKSVDLIAKLLDQNFTVEEIKSVIYKKSRQWMGDAEMQKFLRPETLFGSKFEGYLERTHTNAGWEVELDR